MSAFLLKRVAQYALVLFVAISLNFILPRAMPGSPLAHIAGEEVGRLTAAERERILAEAGLDQPLPVQYVRYLGSLAQGNLGTSFQQKKPVSQVLADRLPWTLLLGGTSLVLATALGMAAGILAAWRRGRATDVGSLGLFLFLHSLPGFWVGMLLMAVFGVGLSWFPTFGARDAFSGLEGWAYWQDVGHHLVLPVTTLVIVTVSSTFLTMRASVLEVVGEDYVNVARAKGLHGQLLVLRHVLPNALLPVITAFMLNLGYVLAGATVVETVFSYPGIGRTLYEAALARDYPLLQGGFLLLTFGVVLANLLADLLYPFLDPRVTARAQNG